jgi:hypothetical protein
MTQLIIYPNPLGKIVIVSPAPDADITEVAASVVPADTPHRIIDADDLPPASEWLWSDEGPIVPAPPAPIDPKLIGIEFDGIMCSATAQDQNGLAAVLLAIQLQGAAFQPTRFYFSNGNILVISLANYQAFTGVWLPFRQSFFMVES